MIKVSPQDEHLLSEFEWKRCHGYPARWETIDGKKTIIYLHRVIMAAGLGEIIDHASGDKLDARRENLRRCTHAENMRNSRVRKNNKLGIKGVYYDSRKGKFRAAIRLDGRKTWLGLHSTAEQAKAAYDAAAKLLHGAFARA